MHRFIVIAWNRENPHAVERARRIMRSIDNGAIRMQLALQTDSLTIYCATDSPESFEVYRGAGAPVVVLGKLFHADLNADEPPAPVALNEGATRDLLNSQGRALMQRYWGSYVGFICEERSGSLFIVRDPIGHMPCYVTALEDVSLIFSCMEDCIALGVRTFSTNWRYVAAFLLRPYIEVRQTGLNEVQVIAPGECLEIRKGLEHRRHYYWDLVDFAAENPIEDVSDAVLKARNTLRACAGAWAAGHSQVMHRLSGGLDSSIVLAGLMHAPTRPEVTCIHHFDQSLGADERPFARMAAEGASASSGRPCRLLEFQRTAHKFNLEQLASFPRGAFPARYVGYLSERYIGPRATADGKGIQFNGSGGDATFGRLWDHSPAVDYVWRHGLGRRLPRVALEAAQGRGTFYGALAHAIRDGLVHRNRSHTITKQWLMINDDAMELARADTGNHLTPAWRQAMSPEDRRLSPEKIRQMDYMTVSWGSLDPFERVGDWQWYSPINSQPVAELFARLPLYVLMDGGQERTIARRAFAPYLPEKLLWRRTKSFFDDFNLELTRHYERFLKEMFLDGVLIKERIVDRRAVESVFARMNTHSDPIITRLLGPQLNMEAWLRNWRRGEDVPAARVTAA